MRKRGDESMVDEKNEENKALKESIKAGTVTGGKAE